MGCEAQRGCRSRQLLFSNLLDGAGREEEDNREEKELQTERMKPEVTVKVFLC